MLQNLGFWNPEALSKEKLANNLHDSNRCQEQQKYQQLGKLREPKTTGQDEKSAPQYEDETGFSTSMWKSIPGLRLIMMLHGCFGFGRTFEGINPFFITF